MAQCNAIILMIKQLLFDSVDVADDVDLRVLNRKWNRVDCIPRRMVPYKLC